MARFGLKEKAERLGAEVALLESPRMVDVTALAGTPASLRCQARSVAGVTGKIPVQRLREAGGDVAQAEFPTTPR